MADEDRFVKGDLNSVMAAYHTLLIGFEILNRGMVRVQFTTVHLTGMQRKNDH